MSAVYGTVDAADDDQVHEYERHFYRAYARLADNKLVRLIWDWDDAQQRTRTKIPYADQVIYTARDADGRLAAAMAVNLNCPAAFQGEAFGFAPPGSAGDRCCEILNVMATPHHSATALATYGSFIRDFGYGDLLAQGIDIAYSTCTPSAAPLPAPGRRGPRPGVARWRRPLLPALATAPPGLRYGPLRAGDADARPSRAVQPVSASSVTNE